MAARRSPTLGVHLLETITRGMYSEPFHSIREYIQNSYDSIRKARRDGLIGRDAGTITLSVDPMNRTLTIRDNGTGLSPEAASVYLLDLGNSDKARSDVDAVSNAGFRGIGRMAGISYCELLRFDTSDGSGKRCIVEFDAAGINRLTKRGQQPATIVEAIEKNATIDEQDVSDDNHYLEVTLSGISEDSPFLDEELLGNYLSQNAPVHFDPSKWSHVEDIRTLAKEAGSLASLEAVEILVCDGDGNVREDVRRPFRDTFQTADARGKNRRTIRVTSIRGIPLDGTKDPGWWGWVAVHERHGALADVSFAGLRLRMHNIAVGDERIIRKQFRTQSLALWCFGEVHVVDLSLVPNAQRDDFETSTRWKNLQARFQDQAIALERAIRSESAERNTSVRTLTRRAKQEMETANDAIEIGFVSREEQQSTVKRLEKTKDKLECEAKRRKRPENERAALNLQQKSVESVLERVKKVRRTRTNVAWAHLNKQARKVLRSVFKVLQGELEEREFTRIQQKIQTELMPGGKGR